MGRARSFAEWLLQKRVNFDTIGLDDWTSEEAAGAILCDRDRSEARQGVAAGYLGGR
ncbi:hypothetical protein MESS4_520048 [Mesorhizobium sp. STM 4661]|nr:hypothetical protein MESS4_520048 [Mesorhizobium sp. STM 4661]